MGEHFLKPVLHGLYKDSLEHDVCVVTLHLALVVNYHHEVYRESPTRLATS